MTSVAGQVLARKGHSVDGLAVVLQYWASGDGLLRGLDARVERFGRALNLLTNRGLELLLQSVFGLRLEQTCATNAFPFVKPGSMSSGIARQHIDEAVARFARREMEIVRTRMILALGRKTCAALRKAGVDCHGLPHPAARIGGVEVHARLWRRELDLADL